MGDGVRVLSSAWNGTLQDLVPDTGTREKRTFAELQGSEAIGGLRCGGLIGTGTGIGGLTGVGTGGLSGQGDGDGIGGLEHPETKSALEMTP